MPRREPVARQRGGSTVNPPARARGQPNAAIRKEAADAHRDARAMRTHRPPPSL